MKTYHYITALSVAFFAAPVLAQSMAGMPGMASKATVAKTGKGVGVITALDPKAAKITIKHGPIPSVGWPAMTMTFSANPPTLLKGLKPGEKIGFDVTTHGATADVTAVRAQ